GGGSKGTATTPAIDSSAQSWENSETASPSETGSIRRSHGALSVSSVRLSSNPAALTTARSHALNARPAGSRGSNTRSPAKAPSEIASAFAWRWDAGRAASSGSSLSASPGRRGDAPQLGLQPHCRSKLARSDAPQEL